MVDWLSSMQQTQEYYIVNPTTWKDEKLNNKVKKDRQDETEWYLCGDDRLGIELWLHGLQ